MHTWSVLGDIVLTLGVALLFGVAMQALRQSPIIGYLLAGLLIGGPGSLGAVNNLDAIEGIAEIGVALLLFTIGLEFSLKTLRSLGRIIFLGGTLQIAGTAIVTTVLVRAFGLDFSVAIVSGLVVALGSTAVVVRILMDRAQLESNHARLAVGVLLMQDLALVPILLLVENLGGTPQVGDIVVELGVSLIKVVLLAAAMYVVETAVLGWAFKRITMVAERDELLVMLALMVSLGAAWLTHEMGLSAALGAFLAGLLISGAPYADIVRAEIGPIRAGLVTIFFASIGMLADISFIGEHWPLVLGLSLAVIAGKALIASASLRIAGAGVGVALLGGIAVAQMGEFSFVIATAARDASAIGAYHFQVLVSVSLVTLLATPYLIAAADRIANRRAPLGERRTTTDSGRPRHGIVIGYGPAGRRVAAGLAERGIPLVIIDLNMQTTIREPGARFVAGDASRAATLERADIDGASVVAVTIPDPKRSRAIIHRVRSLTPELPIVVRGRYHLHINDLVDSGATHVVDEETSTGELLADCTLAALDEVPS